MTISAEELSQRIMNVPYETHDDRTYERGHRDARYAAAGLVRAALRPAGPVGDDAYFATTAEERATEFLADAKEQAKQAQEWLGHIIDAMDKRKDGGFPIHWCEVLTEKTMGIWNDVARANGAVLVRGTLPPPPAAPPVEATPSGEEVGRG